MIPGTASFEGTGRYRERFSQLDEADFFRCPSHEDGEMPWLSSIGLGTYLGEPDEPADLDYTEAIALALRSGINVVDTAINYRHQRSERNIGVAVADLVSRGELNRNEFFVCTKAGYLSFEGNMPADPRAYFIREYVETGILDRKELVGGMHCMSPAYLRDQIDRSRRNLGLESIDLFYLHNPETQFAEVSVDVFYDRVKHSFGALEGAVKAGKIGNYGLATWNAFRVPDGARDYISLQAVVEIAREVGGDGHHFRFVQLPFNLAMPEAYLLANQIVGKKSVSLLEAAAELGITVVGSATLYQGRLAHGLPKFVGQTLGMKSDAENAIQFSRSTPGLAVSLVGMGRKEHVATNLSAGLVPPANIEEWQKLFTSRNA